MPCFTGLPLALVTVPEMLAIFDGTSASTMFCVSWPTATVTRVASP